MIQWEEVTLDDATHFEINGEVHGIYGGKVIKSGKLSIDGKYLCISILIGMYDWMQIPQEAFPLLGIKCLRKKKREREPIEFEGEFVKFDGRWDRMPEFAGSAYKNCKTLRFRCVQIMEEEE
jgi:hypothetical protein